MRCGGWGSKKRDRQTAFEPLGFANQSKKIKRLSKKNGGRGWFRTSVGSRQQIYSLPPLATRALFLTNCARQPQRTAAAPSKTRAPKPGPKAQKSPRATARTAPLMETLGRSVNGKGKTCHLPWPHHLSTPTSTAQELPRNLPMNLPRNLPGNYPGSLYVEIHHAPGSRLELIHFYEILAE